MLAFGAVLSLFGGQYVNNLAAFSALADATMGASARLRAKEFSIVKAAIW